MVSLSLFLNGDGVWPDLAEKDITHVNTPIQISALEGGMESGKPSVTIRIDVDEKKVVIAETSLALFLTAADGLKARYGDPRK